MEDDRIILRVKHGKNKYEVAIEPTTTGEELKLQMYSLTNVEPDRMKIIIKGKYLANDQVLNELNIAKRTEIIMMGKRLEDAVAQKTEDRLRIKFVEDMTEAEAAQQEGATPAGLQNLGNTCYLNSTLQVMRHIPEVQDSLAKYDDSNALSLVSQLKQLFDLMSKTQGDVPPLIFLHSLRLVYPQFAERAKSGHGYAQQDAEEAWSQIISLLKEKLTCKDGPDSNEAGVIDKYFGGEFLCTLAPDDPEAVEKGEKPTFSKELFLKLNCHIDKDTNHLHDGIVNGLTEQLEKKSRVLDRDITYIKRSKISRLPKYLTVHFVRFFWKRENQKKAKIMRKVTFPHELDVVEFCTDELKESLVPVRDKVREIRKDEEDFERARKRRKMNPLLGGDVDDGSYSRRDCKNSKKDDRKKRTDAEDDIAMGETYRTDAEHEAEKAAALLAAKKELFALIDPELAKDNGAHNSGLYELRGVVTHQGASADSGHYTSYVKKPALADPETGKTTGQENGMWWLFNDDKVSEVPAEKIDALAGGGESASALILLYRAIPLPLPEEGN